MNVDFSKGLIKGKIAEIIFEQMFRESGNYTILHTGYEHTMPELAQYRRTLKKEVVEDVSGMPDFVLISNDKKALFIVEVKYRSKIYREELKEIARVMLKKWNPSWLFVTSPDGFFFEPCHTIVNNEGRIGSLYSTWVNKRIQNEYLNLLREFEK